MKTISLTDAANDWRAIVGDVEAGASPVALTIDATICGILLPSSEATHVVKHYSLQERGQARAETAMSFEELPTYLDLLRADPSLVPVVDGQPLEFLTMMNSSYVDPQQIYQFRHPRTRQLYLYHAEELKQAIGRTFARVEFIPAHPKEYVEGKE
jgi:hypothetical protein